MTLASCLNQAFEATFRVRRNSVSIQQKGTKRKSAKAIAKVEQSLDSKALHCWLKISC
jgi:hypothetical protein